MKQIKAKLAGALVALSVGVLNAQSVELLKLAELESKVGKGGSTTYVVNFWATWCAPCVKELPHFQEIQNKYSGSDVKVMLVSLDSKSTLDSKVKPFVSRTGMTADFYLLDETNQQEYIDRISSSWSGALPATMIVNTARGKKKFIEGELSLKELEEALLEVRD